MRNRFSPITEIEFEQDQLNVFCERFRFPKLKVRSVLIQENIRVLHSIAVSYWEFEFLRKIGELHVLQRWEARPFVREIIRKYLQPIYERRYEQKVCQFEYKLIYRRGQYHFFSIAIFEDQIISLADEDFRSMQDRQAGLLAKKLRELTGRGPKKTKAVWVRPNLIVYLLSGLLSKGNRQFAAMSNENAKSVERMIKYNLLKAVGSISTGNGQNIQETLNIIDVENDSAISLVFVQQERD